MIACFLYSVIRLSSPNLNLLIGLGAIILYGSIIVTVLPLTGPNFRVIECNVCQIYLFSPILLIQCVTVLLADSLAYSYRVFLVLWDSACENDPCLLHLR